MNRNIYSIPSKIKKILIVAGNYQEFKDFCDCRMDNENDNPGTWDGTDFIYYSSPNDVQGKLFDDYYLIGTYKLRKDYNWDMIRGCIK
jgi:hypothetical protein